MRKRPRLWSLVPKMSCALALAGFVATLGLPQRAQAQDPDNYYVSYYDVATSAAPSRAGYGGPGFSGGAGDNTVRITNPTSANGTLCAMFYVFDDFEEMQACCGCPVTPDGLRTLSVINNLTFDFGVNKGNLNAGVIKLISSTENFTAGNPPPAPLPPGTNGSSSGTTPGACDPTGTFGGDPRATAVNPTPALRAWVTHDELQEPGNIVGGTAVQGASGEEFQSSPLDSTELANLQEHCALLITGGSGAGTCTCGSGDISVAKAKTASTRHHHHHH